MHLRIRTITFDCREPLPISEFWSHATGFQPDPENPNLPDDDEALLLNPSPGGPNLLFIKVPESKSAKNRVHLDLEPNGVTRDEMVEDLLRNGASVASDHRRPDGTGWAVLFDPESNELCVERSVAERGAGG
jgi:hypothetical protein